MKLIEVCSGIGGFSKGFRDAGGFEIIGHSEIEQFPDKVYHHHFPESECLGDLTTIDWGAYLDKRVNLWYIKLSEQQKKELDMSGKRKDFDEAVRLYESGLSIQEVADFYGVSRQSMWATLKIREVKFRDHLKFGPENHFYRGTKSNGRTHDIFEKALEKGIIVRKSKCEKCGGTGTFKDGRTAIQAHHHDYNKPLDVMWLCQSCHHEWHKHNKAIPRKEVKPLDVPDNLGVDIIAGGIP